MLCTQLGKIIALYVARVGWIDWVCFAFGTLRHLEAEPEASKKTKGRKRRGGTIGIVRRCYFQLGALNRDVNTFTTGVSRVYLTLLEKQQARLSHIVH